MSRIWCGALGIGIALFTIVGCGAAPSADREGSLPGAGGAAPALTAITIDPQIGETFAAAPRSAAPKLTAQQAWARYAGLAGSTITTVPSGVTVRLGLLTLPAGPAEAPASGDLARSHGEAYTALGELAYSWPSGCLSTFPGAIAPGARCLSWTFLNANTGKQIDQTWQKIAP